MNWHKLKSYETIGCLAIFILAVMLHFVNNFTDSVLGIIFGAVNESIWENVKIFAVPYIAWAVMEVLLIHPPLKQFTVAKVSGLCVLLTANIISHYTYTMFTGGAVVAVDIVLSIVWLCLSQIIAFNLANLNQDLSKYFSIAVLILFLFAMMLFTFTVFPPKVDLFLDKNTNTYGVPVKGLLPEAVFYNLQV